MIAPPVECVDAPKPYILVPDIAVEVVSPTDQYSDVMKKVHGYRY
jgi:Uma2 family endonuclease